MCLFLKSTGQSIKRCLVFLCDLNISLKLHHNKHKKTSANKTRSKSQLNVEEAGGWMIITASAGPVDLKSVRNLTVQVAKKGGGGDLTGPFPL